MTVFIDLYCVINKHHSFMGQYESSHEGAAVLSPGFAINW